MSDDKHLISTRSRIALLLEKGLERLRQKRQAKARNAWQSFSDAMVAKGVFHRPMLPPEPKCKRDRGRFTVQKIYNCSGRLAWRVYGMLQGKAVVRQFRFEKRAAADKCAAALNAERDREISRHVSRRYSRCGCSSHER